MFCSLYIYIVTYLHVFLLRNRILLKTTKYGYFVSIKAGICNFLPLYQICTVYLDVDKAIFYYSLYWGVGGAIVRAAPILPLRYSAKLTLPR